MFFAVLKNNVDFLAMLINAKGALATAGERAKGDPASVYRESALLFAEEHLRVGAYQSASAFR
jgi:hypothetical protein